MHQRDGLVAYLCQEMLWPCKWQSRRVSWALVDGAAVVLVGWLVGCFELA